MKAKLRREATYGVTQINLVFRYGAAPGKRKLGLTNCDPTVGRGQEAAGCLIGADVHLTPSWSTGPFEAPSPLRAAPPPPCTTGRAGRLQCDGSTLSIKLSWPAETFQHTLVPPEPRPMPALFVLPPDEVSTELPACGLRTVFWPGRMSWLRLLCMKERSQRGLGSDTPQSCSDAKVTKPLRECGNCSCCSEAQSHTFHSYGHSSASTTF